MQKKLCKDKNFEVYYIVLVWKWWQPKFLELPLWTSAWLNHFVKYEWELEE